MKREEILAVYAAGPEAVVELIEHLLAMVARLETESAALRARVQALEQKLGQNSRNSHQPPSCDGFARPASLRRPSGRSPGGQKGHPGHTLRMSEQPDRISVHQVLCCEHCHRPLEDVPAQDGKRRLFFDLPEFRLEVTEHRAERQSCPRCREVSRAPFPPDVTRPVQYGTRVRAMAAYLSQYQLLPYERIKELFADLFAHAISPATLVAANHALADQLAPLEEETKEQIRQAPVAHFDETGIRVDGRLHWLHTASTATATAYALHPQGGRPALEDMDVLPPLCRHGGARRLGPLLRL